MVNGIYKHFNDYTKLDVRTDCNFTHRSAVKKAFKVYPASKLLVEPSVMHTDSKNMATTSCCDFSYQFNFFKKRVRFSTIYKNK